MAFPTPIPTIGKSQLINITFNVKFVLGQGYRFPKSPTMKKTENAVTFELESTLGPVTAGKKAANAAIAAFSASVISGGFTNTLKVKSSQYF